MMYYIDSPQTCRAANKKCAEIQDYVNQFKNCLIADELSRDALIQDIRRKVAELNEAYPRTKHVKVDFSHGDWLSARSDIYADNYVFIIRILPVRRHYRFAERSEAGMLVEGGA